MVNTSNIKKNNIKLSICFYIIKHCIKIKTNIMMKSKYKTHKFCIKSEDLRRQHKDNNNVFVHKYNYKTNFKQECISIHLFSQKD